MAALTEEQTMIQDQAKSWATEQAPVAAFRKMRDSGVEAGFTPATWEAMIEMGAAYLAFAEAHIGVQYDLKNLVDLARYLLPTPPVPTRFRRRMLTLGSGDPTEKLICSALIARAFQSVRYPILPHQWWAEDGLVMSQVRHYSVYVPRDFDLSPYFEIVKPTVAQGFDHRVMNWSTVPDPDGQSTTSP